MKYLSDALSKSNLALRLTAHDLRSRFLGSTLGFVWAFIQPLVMTIILWFVVGIAFKANAVRGVPFLAWLLAGMSVWSFFADALSQATVVFCEYAFLVKKINFKLSVLPLMKILTALAIHAFFLLIVVAVLLFYRIEVSWHWLAVLYYLFAAAVLLVGLSWITATLQVFFRDVGPIVNVGLQFGFWVTPVFWDFTMIPHQGHAHLLQLLRLNPVVYIVEGYRNSLFFNTAFGGAWWETLYFWFVALLLLVLGRFIFRKLKPQFADVL